MNLGEILEKRIRQIEVEKLNSAVDQAYEMVKSGEWSLEKFREWCSSHRICRSLIAKE